MTLALLMLLTQTPAANCIGNACTVGQRGNDVTLGGVVKTTVGPLGDGGTAYIKPATQGVPLVIQSEQPTGTSGAAAVTIQATNKHDGGTVLSVKNGPAEVMSVSAGGVVTATSFSGTVIPQSSGVFGYVDAGIYGYGNGVSIFYSGGFISPSTDMKFPTNTGVTVDYLFSTSNKTVNIWSEKSAGSSAVGTIINTDNAFGSGDKILSVQNNDSEKFYVAYNGDMVSQGTLQVTSFILTNLADTTTAPTLTGGCTNPSVTWNNGSALFQLDVGGTCTGISTIVLNLPTATNGWECKCTNITAPATRSIDSSAWATGTVTITNYSRTLGTAADFTDGTDIRCMCRGG